MNAAFRKPPGRRPLSVGYISTQVFPSTETDTQQVISTVDALATAGVDIELIMPRLARPAFAGVAALDAEVRAFYGVDAGFRIRPVLTVPPSRVELERPLHGVFASLSRGRRYDLVHTRSRATLITCVAARIPVVFETYRRLGHDAPIFSRILARASRSPFFLGAITHSHQSAESLRHAGVAGDKIAVIHNGFDPRKLRPQLTKAEARAKLGVDADAPMLVYTGNVQKNKGLHTLLDMAARIPAASFWIVGGSPRHLPGLKADIGARGLTNVHTPGWVPADALLPYLYGADVLLIPPTAGPLQQYGRTVLPMKVFSYIAAGRPILAGDLPDVAEVLVDGENALLVRPDDVDAAVMAAEALLADRELAQRLGQGARATSEGLTWAARAEKVEAQYRRWLDR